MVASIFMSLTKSSFYKIKCCNRFSEEYLTGGFSKNMHKFPASRLGFFLTEISASHLFIFLSYFSMIEQAIGREAHQQTKALEQYLIYENLVNQELVRKKCKDELIQEFL